jgi:hypothetical protein
MDLKTHFVLPFIVVTGVLGAAAEVRAANADPNIVVILRGVGELMADPPIADALCYQAELVDAHTDRVIGSGIDCLENIQMVGGGISLDRTTFFHFPQGELVASGITTVAPVTGGSPGFTHVVGDIPAPGTNSIVDGTRRFSGATGSVRLSGAVDLSGFPAATGFNCIFVIDLD